MRLVIGNVILRGTLGLSIAFAGAQLLRPELKDLPHQKMLASADVPADVQEVFERACQDCHSNNTTWPWYARTVPVSWMVAGDVERGRAFMNLSNWAVYSRPQRLGYLAGIAGASKNREMPPRLYSLLHPQARLSDGERALIANWAKQEFRRLRKR